MKSANIAAWAAENHFLVAEIEGKTMRVTPVSFKPVTVVDANGNPVQAPFEIKLP